MSMPYRVPATVARADQLAILWDAVRSAAQLRRPRVVTVRADGGMGKTTLLRGFAEQLAERDIRAGFGACGHSGEGYGPMRWALRNILDRERRRGGDRAKRLAAQIWRVSPEWLGAIPGIGGVLRAIHFTVDTPRRESQGRAALTLADQFLDVARELSQDQPLALLLDDLQWADAAAAGLIFDIARAAQEEELPVLIVASYREAARTPLPIVRALRDLRRYLPIQQLVLPPLAEPAIAELIARVTGYPAPPSLTTWLKRRSGGNPLFAAELLRTVLERSALQPSTWTAWSVREALARLGEDGPAVPETIEAVLAARLEDLAAEDLRVLRAASVLGEPVRPADLVPAAGLPQDAVDETLRRLCQEAGLLVSVPDGAYRFTFNLLPDLLIREMKHDRYGYAGMHRRAAEAIEARPYASDFDWDSLSRHWWEAGAGECVLATVHRYARNAYRDGAGRPAALDLAQRVQRWMEDSPGQEMLAHAEVLVAHAWISLQQFPVAIALLDRATARMRERPDDFAQACALVLQASTEHESNSDHGRFDLPLTAAQLIEPLLVEPLRGAISHPVARAYRNDWMQRAYVTASWVAMRRRDWVHVDLALEGARHSVAPPGAVGFWNWAGTIAQVQGESMAQRGRWHDALGPLRESLAIARAERHAMGDCVALGWLGLAMCWDGAEAAGLENVRAALVAERDVLASPEGAAKWLQLLGEFYLERSDWAAAARLLWLARDLWRELGHTQLRESDTTLERLRAELGPEEYGRMRASVRLRDSEWATYAMRWGIEVGTGPSVETVIAPGTGESLAGPTVCRSGPTVHLIFCRTSTRGGVDTADWQSVDSVDGEYFDVADSRPVSVTGFSAAIAQMRAQRVGDRLMLSFTAESGGRRGIWLANGETPESWGAAHLAVPPDRWREAAGPGALCAVLVPYAVDGRWWMYLGGRSVWAAWSDDPAMEMWQLTPRPVLTPRLGFYDSAVVQPGPPPVETPDGLLLPYHAVDRDGAWYLGQALVASQDPSQLLRRAPDPLLRLPGRDPSATGLIRLDARWLVYFAAPDGIKVARAEPR